jgi:hypothetical protein
MYQIAFLKISFVSLAIYYVPLKVLVKRLNIPVNWPANSIESSILPTFFIQNMEKAQ